MLVQSQVGSVLPGWTEHACLTTAEEIVFSNSAGWYTAVPVGSDYYYLIKRMSETHLSINIEAFVEFTPAQVRAAPLAFTRPE